VEVVPILVGGFHPYIANDETPEDDSRLARVLETLAMATAGRRVLIVASGDLAHVGPVFHGNPLDAKSRAALAAADQELMGCMERGDAAGFFAAIRRVRDCNNVCGVAPIYLTLRLLQLLVGRVSGEPAGYAVCPADAQGSSVVTVGGMIFR
jgi:AmmeMemoRadiSam system protein B